MEVKRGARFAQYRPQRSGQRSERKPLKRRNSPIEPPGQPRESLMDQRVYAQEPHAKLNVAEWIRHVEDEGQAHSVERAGGHDLLLVEPNRENMAPTRSNNHPPVNDRANSGTLVSRIEHQSASIFGTTARASHARRHCLPR